MAVGLTGLPRLYPIAGVRLGTTAAGIRKKDRRDLVVLECAPGTTVAALFTRNRFSAAPVQVARAHLAVRAPRALLINTGFANAGTGQPGIEAAQACCEALAESLGCLPEEILPFSTGVIGERLPVDRLVAGLPAAVAALAPEGWADAALGIMTTDTVPKGSSRRTSLGGQGVTVTGIAKGAGMIRPDMATMLAFIATDAVVSRDALSDSLRAGADASFNRITVDGDTSTNDAVVLLATGQAGNPMVEPASADHARLQEVVGDVCSELAQAIVRDAEGATKFITIEVSEGRSKADCLAVAYTVAHSPLVKTAFFASDPNWGRILAAIGRVPIAELDVSRVSLSLNGIAVVRNGALAPDYTEARGADAMRPAEIAVRVGLGMGAATERVWTCDLSYDYVRINAEYRT